MILTSVNKEFYHEKIEKEKQLFNITLDIEKNYIQLSFNPDKLKQFLDTL